MWRALKPKGQMNLCGCETDDDSLSDEHIDESPDQSAGDRGRAHHYPVDQSPKTYCVRHKASRPCECDTKKPQPKNSPTKTNTKSKGKKR